MTVARSAARPPGEAGDNPSDHPSSPPVDHSQKAAVAAHLAAHVAWTVSTAPALTAEQRDKLALLLRSTRGNQ